MRTLRPCRSTRPYDNSGVTPTLPVDVESWRNSRDEPAARRLMDALYPQVIRIVRNHLPFRADEEDLAQEIFLQFFKTLDRYDAALPLENWMSRLALNVCLKALRSSHRRPELRWADLSEEQRAAMDSLLHHPDSEVPADEASASDTKALLTRLLDSLSAQDRLIITLLHLEEKSLKEIQSLTGWTSIVIRMRAYRARRKLRKMLMALEGHSS
jgi:RNA polymerase sigma-70 factor (ECF subfamily)